MSESGEIFFGKNVWTRRCDYNTFCKTKWTYINCNFVRGQRDLSALCT